MKASKLPDKKEWDKIVDEAFSSSDEHTFSHGYNAQKYTMTRGITMKRRKVDNKRHGGGRIALSIAAAAAAFAIVPTAVFFAGHSGGASSPAADMGELTETTAAEETTAEALAETMAEHTISLEDVRCYGFKDVQLNYVPEGLVYQTDGPYCGKYHDDATGGGMSYARFVYDENAEFIQSNFEWDSDEYDLEGKHVIVRYARDINDDSEESAHRYSRYIFVIFKDSPYLVTLHIDNSYSDEEARKVCEGMELVDCEPDEFNFVLWKDSSPLPRYSDEYYYDSHFTEVGLDDVHLYQIGETYTSDIWDGVCDITVNSARVQDNLDGITTDACGWDYDYSSLLDENGKIKPCLRTWYSNTPNGFPNGVVTSENIKKRVVVLDLTYTNNSDHEIEYGISPHMCCYDDGHFSFVEDPIRIEGSDTVNDNVKLSHDRGGFFSFNSDNKGGKNSVILGAGESTDVQLAFEVDDDDIGYLMFCDDTGYAGSTMGSYFRNAPVVDLRDIDIYTK